MVTFAVGVLKAARTRPLTMAALNGSVKAWVKDRERVRERERERVRVKDENEGEGSRK